MWGNGSHIFTGPAQVYLLDRVHRFPRSTKRGQAQCRSTSQVSASIMFSNSTLVKAVTWSCLDSRDRQINSTSWWGLLRSHIAKGSAMQKRAGVLVAVFCRWFTIPLLPFQIAASARTPMYLAGSVTGLVGLHVSCFSCGKIKWFGGNKGKDVKCLKLPKGIVSITFPYLYKNKITHICIFDIYVYTHTNYVYTHTYCVLLVTMHADRV